MTVSFVDAAHGDFHLSAIDTSSHGNGVDLSGDSHLSFSTDIDGQARTAPWDIGADQIFFQVIPAATTTTIIWQSSLATSSSISYGTTTGYGFASSSAGLVTQHSITLKGLTPKTNYHFLIASTNFGDQTFQTLENIPPVITSFSLKATSSQYAVPIVFLRQPIITH